jgi:NitT/TauT family transport system ATP-binding protein
VLVEGVELRGIRRKTSVIFQDYGLLPWKTVRENAELPLRIAGAGRGERARTVGPILEELGLDRFSRSYPSGLSGGMRQRLAIARALAAAPDLLLMDEPFSSLDALTRESLQEMLLAVHARHAMTVLIVTHSIEEAAYLADVVLVMGGRNPGRLAASVRSGRPRRDEPRFLEVTTTLRRYLVEGAAS